MAARNGITLYHSPAVLGLHLPTGCRRSWAFPFGVLTIDQMQGRAEDPPAYLKLNPAGKVPTLTDGDVVVSENPAIAIYLADRYGYGTLAPKIDEAARGPYL